eukprot:1235268-Rhodomonas_salina.1
MQSRVLTWSSECHPQCSCMSRRARMTSLEQARMFSSCGTAERCAIAIHKNVPNMARDFFKVP